MSAPGETAPATLSAEWQAMADRTGRPFADGGAYASDMFADWRGCVAALYGYGFTLRGAEQFLRSKHMRWCSDRSDAEYGCVPVQDLDAYLGTNRGRWRHDFSMTPEAVTASGEATGPSAAADTSDDAAACLAKAAATATAWEQMWRAHTAIAKAGGPLVAPIDLVLAFNRARDALQALGVDP